MASNTLSSVECPICKDTLKDPRALACGHSFCGKPRTCLKAILSEDGRSSKCAVCKAKFKVHPDNLKPLYGIRDLLSKIKDAPIEIKSDKRAQETSWIDVQCPASHLAGKKATFWCEDCFVEFCMVCLECGEHAGHRIQSLSLYLLHRVFYFQSKLPNARLNFENTHKFIMNKVREEEVKKENTPSLRRAKLSLNSEKRLFYQYLSIDYDFNHYFTKNMEKYEIINYLQLKLDKIVEKYESKTITLKLNVLHHDFKSEGETVDVFSNKKFNVQLHACRELSKRNVAYLSLYLIVKRKSQITTSSRSSNSPVSKQDWSLPLNCYFKLINRDKNVSSSERFTREFNRKISDYGFLFVRWDDLACRYNGWIDNNSRATVEVGWHKIKLK